MLSQPHRQPLLFDANYPSRVLCRAHLQGLDKDGMQQYLTHHLKLAGVKKPLFDETAITAIHQGSGGLLRKANHLARGGLMAAAAEKCQAVSAEHARQAAPCHGLYVRRKAWGLFERHDPRPTSASGP